MLKDDSTDLAPQAAPLADWREPVLF